MNKKETKTKRIIVRATDLEKEKYKKNAKAAGMTVSRYIHMLNDKTVIVSLIQGQKLVKEIHDIHLYLHNLQKAGISVEELQDVVSKCAISLHWAMMAFENERREG